MRRAINGLLLAAGLSLMGAGLLGVSSAGAATTSYVTCSPSASAPQAHECKAKQQMAAWFRSDVRMEYTICISGPEHLCLENELAFAGVPVSNRLSLVKPGAYTVVWTIPGSTTKLAEWNLEISGPYWTACSSHLNGKLEAHLVSCQKASSLITAFARKRARGQAREIKVAGWSCSGTGSITCKHQLARVRYRGPLPE